MIDVIDSLGASALFITATSVGMPTADAYQATLAAIVGCAVWRWAYSKLLAKLGGDND